MLPPLGTLREIVRTAAREELLPRFADVQRHIKLDGSVVTEVDHAMQRRLQSELARHWPQYTFLGEEMSAHEHEQLTKAKEGGMWCLDPLDGTSNYAAGIPYFSVSLALLIDGRTQVGLVYDPVRDECFSASRGHGAWLNESALAARGYIPETLKRCIGVVDFKRLESALAAQLGAHPPYGSQRNFGSSSLDWCWLADGRFHVYLHGGQKLWDYAAGSLILAEAGGRVETLDGEEVLALGLVPRSVIAALDSGLFTAWKRWITENRATNRH
jgi:myo-inositol-1(or 4)-monophosphatase